MAQPLFHAEQYRLLVAGFGEDDAIGMQPDAGERRREQVTSTQAPQDGAVDAGEHAGDEQRGRRAVDGAESTAGDLVQRAEDQPALRQAVIDRGDAERHDAALRPAGLLDAGNPVAQLVENACMTRAPYFLERRARAVCSYFVLRDRMRQPRRERLP